MEVFKKIKTHGKYEVSNYGTVRNFETKRVLSKRVSKMGIEIVALSGGVTTYHYVRRLVAQQFIDNPKKLDCVGHIDGNRLNCHESNLYWCDLKHLKSVYARKKCQIKIKGVPGLFRNVSDCAKFFNVSNDVIKKVIEGNEVNNSFNIEWNVLTP
jgi:hypothetical protein